MAYNDVLHRIRTSDEMLDPLRAFVTDKNPELYAESCSGMRTWFRRSM